MVDEKTDFGYVRSTDIEEEMRSSYLDYAMSVIVSRALPDVRDGLKPVQRRILYAMRGLGMRPNTSFKKSARLVGEVLGKYHPHGDTAVNEAMVRMVQSWSMRLPLVDGQGNFGSVDGDPAAAMRYTETRLTTVSEAILANLDQDTVDFIDNFDGSLREPVVLPSKLPNLLINGASGIAVGMATNIAPHNPSEICDAIIHLIDKPDATLEDLMRFVKGPDFPTGATIMGREGIKTAFATGRGQVIVRAKAEIEETKRTNRMQIVVSELPYQVNKANLVSKMAGLVKDKRIEGIAEIRDESDRDGMRVVVELKPGAQPRIILNQLYKYTPMQSSFSSNMLALVQGTPKMITLRRALGEFIEFRQEVVTRRTEYELKKAKERAHILAGLRIALSNLDAVIKLIRSSSDTENARNGLIEKFGLDELQAQAILEMQLRRLAALERQRLEEEYQNLRETIENLEGVLSDPIKILKEIKKETRELKKKVGGPRRTDITDDAYDLSREELEVHEPMVVTLSKGGYVKRISASTYRNQHRGGKGVTSMNTREDDPVRHILVVDTHDNLLFFTNKGRVFSIKAYELRNDVSRNTRGVPIINVIALNDMERVSTIIGVSNLGQEDAFLVMATRKGSIKRLALNTISKIRTSGLIMMKLKAKDELVDTRMATAAQDIILVSEQGQSIRFPVSAVTTRQRAAGGVKGMTLRPKDRVMSMDVGGPDNRLLVISKRGYGKLTPIKAYRTQGRGGVGIKTFNITKKTGLVAAAQVVTDGSEVYVVSEQAQVLRTSLSEISSMGRATQGVTIFKPVKGDYVSSITCVRKLEDIYVPNKDSENNSDGGSRNGHLPLDGIK